MDHRAFLERWFAELWGKRNAKIIDECVAENCEIVGLPDTGRGRRAVHDFFVGFGALFPQVRVMVEDCMSDGERFAMRCAGYVVDDKGARHSFSGVRQDPERTDCCRFEKSVISPSVPNW